MGGESKSASSVGYKDLLLGGGIQCVEAATLGMPFEVWKTYMGRNRALSSSQALLAVYRQGGLGTFWTGLGPKLVESASKGAILLYAKEGLLITLAPFVDSPGLAGACAGAGAGVAQVSVMGPCTFLVTAAVTSKESGISASQRVALTYKEHGLKGFYPGGTAIAWRQATNWAARQGFTDAAREQLKRHYGLGEKDKLSKWQEAACGVVGGTLSTINQPFEVARIEMQASAAAGKNAGRSMVKVMGDIVKTDGVAGLFTGIVPRIGLGVWQTLFMVTGARMLKDEFTERGWMA